MQSDIISEYRRLKNAGWDVDKTESVKFNGGSESRPHMVVKLLAVDVCREVGYQIDTEVEGPHGVVDVLAYHPKRLNYCIEIETDASEDVIRDKKQRYVDSNQVIDEIWVLDPHTKSTEYPVVAEDIKRALGFDYEL